MSELIAKVNEINIHRTYLDRILYEYLDKFDKKNISKYDIEEYKTEILETLIDRALLVYHAKKEQNIKVYEDDIYSSKLITENGEVEIKNLYNLNNIEEIEDAKQELIKQKIIKQIVEENETFQYDNDILKKFYEENKGLFNGGDAVKVYHIFVSTESLKKNNDYKFKYNKIKKAHKLLLNGYNFNDVVNKYSECPSKDSGGDLGYITKNQIDKEFEKEVFKLKINEISGIIESAYGYHIAKITDRNENYILPFGKIKTKLEITLKENRAEYMLNNLLENLREEAQINIYGF